MRIGILTNDIMPSFGTPCAGVAVRALGLYQGLTAHGIDAQILLPRALVSDRRKRWKAFYPRFPQSAAIRVFRSLDWLILKEEYDYIITCNWGGSNYVDRYNLASSNLVYDFFSPSLIEFSNSLGLEDKLQQAYDVKKTLVEASHFRIANGPLIADYARNWLSEAEVETCTDVFPVACGLDWTGDQPKKPVFLVGGYKQLWTKEIADGWLERLANRFPDAVFLRVGHGLHYHFGAINGSVALSSAPNVIDYEVLAYEDYQRINEIAIGLIDISQGSVERELSVSTRAVASISSGCPVIHNRDTWLGRAMDEHGLEVSLDTTSDTAEEQLADIVDHLIRQGGNIDVKGFWNKHLNPSNSIRNFVRAI